MAEGREVISVDVTQGLPGPNGSSDSRPMSRRGWTWYLGTWSAFNAAVFTLVTWATVSQWPPRGTVTPYYRGPGDGLLFLFFVMVPGGLTFLVNSVVLATILISRRARRDGRAVGWWVLVAAAWIVGLLVVHAFEPIARSLPA